MEECKGNCYRCKYFDRYYTKEEKHFKRTVCGWCIAIHENVSSRGSCERFAPILYKKRPRRVLLMQLHDLLTEISEIRKLIEDDRRDDEENEEL